MNTKINLEENFKRNLNENCFKGGYWEKSLRGENLESPDKGNYDTLL